MSLRLTKDLKQKFNYYKCIYSLIFVPKKIWEISTGSLNMIFPSLGLVSLGLSRLHETCARARVDPIEATQVPNSLPNSSRIER